MATASTPSIGRRPGAGDGVSFHEDDGRKVVTWYYDGGLGPIDWDIGIWDAYSGDEFDLLMTFN